MYEGHNTYISHARLLGYTGIKDSVMPPETKIDEDGFWERSSKSAFLLKEGPIDEYLEKYSHVEVELNYTTEELDDFCAERIAEGWSLGRLAALLPQDYRIRTEIGKSYPVITYSHHSGNIEVSEISLPDGRFAIVGEYFGYDSDDEDDWYKVSIYGVADNYGSPLRVSAKYGGSVRSDEALHAPTEKEIVLIEQTLDVDKLHHEYVITEK